ncbi:sodium:calcium antiporter [Alicyclobacillaceae bacterium I2511]|nr:sodium:calcium antiporter [Alicyclobacillaceae bacterium I2511]
MMLFALSMILFGAELFTNGIEWLGRKLGLGDGAVGSVLAALGTALPETAVPVTAILFGSGSKASQEVGMGGILGAPFLLVTLGSLIMAVALWVRHITQDSADRLQVRGKAFYRDMMFFLLTFSFVIITGVVPWPWLHDLAPWFLVGVYLVFVVTALREKLNSPSSELPHCLYLQWQASEPAWQSVVLQLLLSLLAIIAGAQLLSSGVSQVALSLGMPTFALSALLIPLATELPETLNSVVWIRQGKDALALGNVTGAMVFQSTLVPALGIWLTPWRLDLPALLTGSATLAAGSLLLSFFLLRHRLVPGLLAGASLLYWVLPLQALAGRYDLNEWAAGLTLAIVIAVVFVFRWNLRVRDA